VHPAFYGSFDWHSSVHGHWLLVRLLRLYPDMACAADARARLDSHLTAEALAKEAAYFEKKDYRSFERIVHLVGLNLSRAWTIQGILSALDSEDARRVTLENAERLHAEAGLRHVFSGHYEGEHWLATFAVYYKTNAGIAR
jgi:hypothetical protein